MPCHLTSNPTLLPLQAWKGLEFCPPLLFWSPYWLFSLCSLSLALPECKRWWFQDDLKHLRSTFVRSFHVLPSACASVLFAVVPSRGSSKNGGGATSATVELNRLCRYLEKRSESICLRRHGIPPPIACRVTEICGCADGSGFAKFWLQKYRAAGCALGFRCRSIELKSTHKKRTSAFEP